MGKYYNSDYDEVTAFSQEELDAKLKEEREKAEKEAQEKIKEAEEKAKTLEEEKARLDEKLTKRSEEYNNLKKKFEETGEKLNSTEEEKKTTYEKMRDDMIKKLAGDDTEYAEKLQEKYEKVGSQTLDPSELESQMKDAHAMALTSLERDYTPFSLSDTNTGKPPEKKSNENQSFTETPEGEATLNTVFQAMGQEPAKKEAEAEKK